MKSYKGRRVLPDLTEPPPKPDDCPIKIGGLPVSDEALADFLACQAVLDREEQEIEHIKASRPLGAGSTWEPRSIHTKPPDLRKRKLLP